MLEIVHFPPAIPILALLRGALIACWTLFIGRSYKGQLRHSKARKRIQEPLRAFRRDTNKRPSHGCGTSRQTLDHFGGANLFRTVRSTELSSEITPSADQDSRNLRDREAAREHDRFGAAVMAGGEQFERTAPSGGRDALARAVAWVAYEGHQAVLTRA